MFKNIPKVSYSLIASQGKFKNLKEALAAISRLGIDCIHYDVSEENQVLSLDDLPKLRQFSRVPFDVHLTAADPRPYLSGLKMDKNDYFCIHVENNYSAAQLKKMKKALGCNFGLAINVETPVNELDQVVSAIDYVLFMAAKPGVSGGAFNENVIEKMHLFKQKYPSVKIHADGGINNYSAAVLRDLGVDLLVSGSYILKDNDYSNQIAKLVGQNLNLPVSELMRGGPDLPAVKEEATIQEVAQEIDIKTIGCTCVVNKNNKFAGLITDTDIRRFIMYGKDTRNCLAKDLMNKSSFRINPDKSLIKLLRELEEKKMFFTVIPVVDKKDRCVGVLRLQDILFRNVLGLRIRHF